MNTRLTLLLLMLLTIQAALYGQINIEGYVYESGNRGYIDQAAVTISNEAGTEFYGQTLSDASGTYNLSVANAGTYLINIEKTPHFDYSEVVVVQEGSSSKVYLKHELKRSPGYSFEITLAEKDPEPTAPQDGLKGALVEVYNNTKKREELVIDQLETPDFKINLIKGNHYTVLIRKAGFLSKRMEAFVDVEGCILCFEGIGTVTPGVSDNLSESNTIGVLLANVEMDRYFSGKVIGLNDIYYDFGKSEITPKAATELVKVADFLKDNPQLKIELGSHTDSRGGGPANLSLSEKRAKAAVDYLVNKKGIASSRIAAKGYGETQLVNKCKDGVECDEDEHRLNRRTELKILDVIDQGMNRALRQMKADELMEEILADIEQSGQIQVPADGDLATAVSAVEKKENTETMSRVFEDFNDSRVKATKAPEPVITEKEEEVIEEEIVVVEEEAIAEEAQEMIKEPVVPSPEVKDIKGQAIETTMEPKGIVTDATFSSASASSSQKYSKDYSGFKIVVIYSRFELPKEHKIYNQYQDVDIYTTADGNKLYMVGSFFNKLEAEQAMLNRYKKVYPQSYVIGFEKGNRIY